MTPFYRRATEEGIQLFVAGCVGLLQVTEEIQFIPYPALTAAGIGVLSPENLAFTRFGGEICIVGSSKKCTYVLGNVAPER